MEQTTTSPAPLGMALKTWHRIPLLIRSVLSGILISSIGIIGWSAAIYFIPAPWSILPTIAVLLAYWSFFSGRKGPKTGARARRENFRQTALSPGTWKWSLPAAVLFVVIVQASFVLTFRLTPFPAAKFTADYKVLDEMPHRVAWSMLIMGSVVAGICEEIGFRGYMQVPIEKKYGPFIAIVVTSLFFTLIHLSHGWALPILPHVFFASVLLGILAYRSGSLIPGILGHSILDIFDYAIWWTGLTGGFKQKTVFAVGVDGGFIGWSLVFLLAVTGFFFLIPSGDSSRDLSARPGSPGS